MTRLLCVRLGAGPSSATLVNLHIVRRVALSQANIWSRSGRKGRANETTNARVVPPVARARLHPVSADRGNQAGGSDEKKPEWARGRSTLRHRSHPYGYALRSGRRR